MAPIVKKPQRPKRAPTAYLMFMKKYLRAQTIKTRKEAQKAIKDGAKKWHTLSQAEKDRYLRNSLKARDEWVRAMEDYRAKVQAYKRPPTPFAAFLRDYLYNEYGSAQGMRVTEICKEAATKWHKLGRGHREDYSRQYQREFQNYQRRMEAQDGQVEDLNTWESSYSVPSTSAEARDSSLEEREARARDRVARFRARRNRGAQKGDTPAVTDGYEGEAGNGTGAAPGTDEAPSQAAKDFGKRKLNSSARARPSKTPRKISKAARKVAVNGRNRRSSRR